MLHQCSRHYGLSPLQAAALMRLALLCQRHYPCGYEKASLRAFSLSIDEAAALLGLPLSQVEESLHYGAIFGLLRDVVISPFHAEFHLNPFHRRDLFFARLRFALREKAITF